MNSSCRQLRLNRVMRRKTMESEWYLGRWVERLLVAVVVDVVESVGLVVVVVVRVREWSRLEQEAKKEESWLVAVW